MFDFIRVLSICFVLSEDVAELEDTWKSTPKVTIEMKAMSYNLSSYTTLAKISDDFDSEQKKCEIFKRPNFLQYSIRLFSGSKALSFLYGANSCWDTG